MSGVNDQSENIRFLRRYNTYLTDQVIKKDDLLSKLKKYPKGLSYMQLKDIEERVNGSFDRFEDRLSKLAPLMSPQELQLCCLRRCL